jgi:dipeptidyl aminopeptidase/acylaminoacyl peptidase
MRRSLILLFTLLSVLPALSQSKRPFTFEDMMALKRVGEPVPSPDGKWVIFSVVDVDLAANKKTPHIWIVPLSVGADASSAQAERSPAGSSSAERVLIPDQDGDRPRWSPDGKRFAFISTKEGGSQVWIADFDGAAGKLTGTRKLTSIATEAGGELWSPDGKNILFTSDVYPECTDEACNAKKLKETEVSKVKAIIFDRLLYRHWNAFKRGMRTHLFVVPAPSAPGARGFDRLEHFASLSRDLTLGDYDAPPFSLGGQDDYAFSPDGQEVCYTSNHDKVEATSTNNDLWIVPVTGGPAKNITADNPASDSTPLYSPDGKYIAYRAQQRPGYESDRFRLMLYDRKTGEKKNLTEDFDRWVGTFVWTPNSRAMYFVSEDEGKSPIYSIRTPSGPVDLGHNIKVILRDKMIPISTPGEAARTLNIDFGYSDELALTADGRTLLFTRMTLQWPNEVFRRPTSNQGLQNEAAGDALPLTHINNAVLDAIAMPPLEPFWFEGAKGDKVQGFLVKPPNFDPTKKYPVKFLIHGGPQGAWGDDWSYRWNPELFAANGYVVIMINFHGSTGYGQKFIDAINGDWGGAPFEDLMKGLDYAEQTYSFIDKDRECALGASYGGYMADWILGHTDRFKCIVSHDGMFNTFSAWGTTEELWFNNWEFQGTPYTNHDVYNKWSPRNSAKNFKTPTLVVHGQLDYRLDVSEGFQLFTTLQTMGVPSKMLYFPDEGHWVLKPQNSQLWYKTVNDWVDQWTKK